MNTFHGNMLKYYSIELSKRRGIKNIKKSAPETLYIAQAIAVANGSSLETSAKNTTSAAESSGNVLAVRQKYAYFVERNGMGQETALKMRIPKCFLQ
jgi:hypothetical protein